MELYGGKNSFNIVPYFMALDPLMWQILNPGSCLYSFTCAALTSALFLNADYDVCFVILDHNTFCPFPIYHNEHGQVQPRRKSGNSYRMTTEMS
jgi:hypothetical protein